MTRNTWRMILVPALFCFAICGKSAMAQNVGPVRNLECLTHSEAPSSFPQIRMVWDFPEGEPYGYYVQFNTNPEHEFDELNTLELTPVHRRVFGSQIFGESEPKPDDVSHYFHIAAFDDKGEVGPTITAGPYRVDVTEPCDVAVIVPETTQARTVTLTLKSVNACGVYLSNEHWDEWETMERIPLTSLEECSETGGRGSRTDTK